MTGPRIIRPFNDQEPWLEQFTVRNKQQESRHLCGLCRTPFGKSTIPCPNETREHQS